MESVDRWSRGCRRGRNRRASFAPGERRTLRFVRRSHAQGGTVVVLGGHYTAKLLSGRMGATIVTATHDRLLHRAHATRLWVYVLSQSLAALLVST